MRRLALIVLLLTVAFVPAVATAKSRSVVSIHLCADHLALLLADRGRVLSVSYLAADPEYSTVVDLARGIPVNHGNADEVIALNPDIVIAGRHAAGFTIATLRRLGFTVVEVATANSIDGVRAEIRQVAKALDRQARGEALIADLYRRLRAVAASAPKARLLAAIYHTGNQTIGGRSLANDIIELAGFENYAATLGIVGYGHLSLERLLVGRPAVLIFNRGAGRLPSEGGTALSHPALAAYLKGARRVVIPSRLWSCPSPAIAEAAARLAAVAGGLQ